jgi:gamma-glutamyltranspeptidase/glutathione hydrolase
VDEEITTSGEVADHRSRERCGNTIVLKNDEPVLSAGSPGNVHCTVPQILTMRWTSTWIPMQPWNAPRMLPMNEARSITIADRLAPHQCGRR